MASEISLEEIASEVRGHKWFCAYVGITQTAMALETEPEKILHQFHKVSVQWCGSGSRRRGRRRRNWKDCHGDGLGCLCGFNIGQPAGGSRAIDYLRPCDTTKCGWNAGDSWSLTWKGSRGGNSQVRQLVECMLNGTYE